MLLLPNVILATLLTEWFVFNEIAMLDTAYCNLKLRERLLFVFSLDSLVINCDQNCGTLFVHWIAIRNLRVLDLNLRKIIRQDIGGFHITRKVLKNMNFIRNFSALHDSNLCDYVSLVNGNIVHLELSDSFKMTDSELAQILCQIINLQGLNIDSCTGLTSAVSKAIVKYCPNLTSFSNKNCTSMRHTAIKMIAKYCKYLTSINIWEQNTPVVSLIGSVIHSWSTPVNLTNIEITTICSFSPACYTELMSIANNLKRFEIIVLPHELWSFNCDGLHTVLGMCVNVIHLSLSCCKLNDVSLFIIANTCKCVTSLMICKHTQITDVGVCAIAENLILLKSLSLNQCTQLTNKSMDAITNNLIWLKTLSIDHCIAITDHDLVGKLYQNLPCFKHLQANHSGVFISFALMRTIKTNLITSVPVEDGGLLYGGSIKMTCNKQGMQSIEVTTGTHEIRHLNAVISLFPVLLHISFIGYDKLTIQNLSVMLSYHKGIESLTLQRNILLTHDVLDMLAEKCRCLHTLNMISEGSGYVH